MKNLMPEVAKLLGVEIGEKFMIKDKPGLFWLTQNALINDRENFSRGITFLVNGEFEIIKLPWKPKKDERYWTVEEDHLLKDIWDNDMMDYSYFKLGNCFRTQEEAEANADRIRKEIMGI